MSTSPIKFLVALTMLALTSMSVHAAQPFTTKAFQEAQAAGKSILIDVYASWCPVCKKQRPIVQQFQKSNPKLTVLEIDFDKDKDALKQFGVQYQSTLIVFKAGKEVGRSTGESDPAAITGLIRKGL